MEEKYCQSCGMPLGNNDALLGAEKDGTKNPDYCQYCYENGAFTFHGTMAEMIEICIPPMMENSPGMSETDARNMMRAVLPNLKRWKTA